MSYQARIRRLATPVFRHDISRRAALRLAARRGRSLVLLYHCVLPDGSEPDPIVPSLTRRLFRQHLDALQRIGDIVPLAELFEPTRGHAPRFAITFDDDYAGYVSTVLPELHAVNASATFFLSGRSLHGLPPYWWTFVEHSLRARGFDSTRRDLGLTVDTVADLAVALERSPCATLLANRLPCPDAPALTASDIASLAHAGMTIGFHTLHHPVLSTLSTPEVEDALVDGRQELAAAAGTRVDLLAYPHGRATASVADAAERAGYSAAFATGGRPITSSSDRFMLDRWEPGPISADDLCAHAALRLLRGPTAPAQR